LRSYETLIYEQDGAVAWVTLNRPEVHNAFNSTMQLELRELWSDLRWDDSVRVIVLTGAGERAFCTGLDVSEAWSGQSLPRETASEGVLPFMMNDVGRLICPKQCDLWKPMIVAVNGMASGGAFYLLGDAEFVIASEHATFFEPHVTYGVAAAYEPIHLLAKMPMQEVMRMALLGNNERMSAQRAHQVGLVSEVVPGDQLHDAANWAAQRIADASPLAVQGTVRAIWTGAEQSRGQALGVAWAFSNLGMDREAMQAFAAGLGSGDRPRPRSR
jgi:enoyl-CoA hydratase/carnithine racemase